MRNTVIPLIGVWCLALAGCTNSFTKVKGAMDQAPEWYEDSRKEIRGEGYPELSEVPVLDAGQLPGKTLPAAEGRVVAIGEIFANDPRAELPEAGAARIEKTANAVRQQFAGLSSDSNFLTDAEIQGIRDKFNVPRVTQGLKVKQ